MPDPIIPNNNRLPLNSGLTQNAVDREDNPAVDQENNPVVQATTPTYDHRHMDQLRAQVEATLEKLERPTGGWFFEKIDASTDKVTDKVTDKLTDDEIIQLDRLIAQTNNVDNIYSFGARAGGFELAMAHKHDLDAWDSYDLSMSPGTVNMSKNYLDAVSLGEHDLTTTSKVEGADIYKSANKFWDVGYKNAMSQADKMIFFITPEWLESDFCKQEYDWLVELNGKGKNIGVAFVIFDTVDPDNEKLKTLRQNAEASGDKIIDSKSPTRVPLEKVAVADSLPLKFAYTLDDAMMTELQEWRDNNAVNRDRADAALGDNLNDVIEDSRHFREHRGRAEGDDLQAQLNEDDFQARNPPQTRRDAIADPNELS